MGKYLIEFTETAIQDLKAHKKSGNKATLKKIEQIIADLELHPYSGIGQPEALKYELHGFWSRRINNKDRIVYKVKENIVTVEVISAKGHYFDK